MTNGEPAALRYFSQGCAGFFGFLPWPKVARKESAMNKIAASIKWSAAMGLLVLVSGNFGAAKAYAQSNEELLEMIKQLRPQIEAQQKQLRQMEQQLKQRVHRPKEVVEIRPGIQPTTIKAAPAEVSDWYIAGFVGGAFPLDTDLKSTDAFIDQVDGTILSTFTITSKGKDVSFDASPLVGGKGGLCPGFFPNLCLEIEFDYFEPKFERQTVRGRQTFTFDGFSFPSGVGPTSFPQLDLSVWNLGLNTIGRVGLLPNARYPLGHRLHLYLGVGPSFIWTTARLKEFGVLAGKKDTDFSVGVQALTGFRYFVTKNVSLFGEYKFKHWNPDFKFSQVTSFNGFSSTERLKINPSSLNANLFYVGLAFHL